MKKSNFYAKREVIYIDGYTESVWKSLVVKALRIGWVEGLEEASKRLPKTTMDSLLVCGLFEDVFPAGYREINECKFEIDNRMYEELCSRNTHHGRGYTERFCNMKEEAITIGRQEGGDIAKELAFNTKLKFINPRVFNCLYTWHEIWPEDKEAKREPFFMPFNGVPKNIADSHTYEGKKMGNSVELLSGHYENHRAIGRRVMKEGWDGIRLEFGHDAILQSQAQPSLF